jgi:hypothetical protein
MNAGEDFSLRGKIAATAAAVALTIALGAVDYLTGREWAITAFYLLPTGLAAFADYHHDIANNLGNGVLQRTIESTLRKQPVKKKTLCPG